MNEEKLIYGVTQGEWAAAYDPGIEEFTSTRIVVRRLNGFCRIAFGRDGAPTDETGGRVRILVDRAGIATPRDRPVAVDVRAAAPSLGSSAASVSFAVVTDHAGVSASA